MQIPKNERQWLTQLANGQVQYIITSPPDRSVYKLYVPDSDTGWQLWGKHKSAGELAKRYEAHCRQRRA